MGKTGEHHWTDGFEPREIAQIEHAHAYSTLYPQAGIPGHGQLLLIAKLAKQLEKYYTYIPEQPRVIKVAWHEITGERYTEL